MNDYTPTTESIMAAYIADGGWTAEDRAAQFDRWHADVIRKAREQAWGEGITSRIRELETTNAHQAKVIEHYTARSESLKETLAMIADRVDDFVYDELSSDIEDVALNELGETYESDKKRLEATIQRVRDLHPPRPNSMSALYPTPLCACGKNYPCPTTQALEGDLK